MKLGTLAAAHGSAVDDVAAGAQLSAAVSGAATAGTAVAGAVAADTVSDISAEAVDTAVVVAAGAGDAGAVVTAALMSADDISVYPKANLTNVLARSDRSSLSGTNVYCEVVKQ